MTSKDPDFPNKMSSSTPNNNDIIDEEDKTSSATTPDIPSFGWSQYAERINGRFAMIGFTAILLIETFSHSGFLHWAGFK